MAKEDLAKELQLVVFKLSDEEYGVEILNVQEIIKMVSLTRLPQMPCFIEGIINLRGKIIPVVDLNKRFSFKTKAYTDDNRIIVIEVNGITVGIIVEEVSEVLRIAANTVETTPSLVTNIEEEYLKGIGKIDDRLLILLDIERIFTLQQKEELLEQIKE